MPQGLPRERVQAVAPLTELRPLGPPGSPGRASYMPKDSRRFHSIQAEDRWALAGLGATELLRGASTIILG